ncbi:MAG: hypothetical protein AMXMBFR77_28040 [Phycisphaerales bacterium]
MKRQIHNPDDAPPETTIGDTYEEDLRRAEAAEEKSAELGAIPVGTVLNGDDRYVYCHVGDVPQRAAKVAGLVSAGWARCTAGEIKVGYRGGELLRKPKISHDKQTQRAAAETRRSLARLQHIVDREWERGNPRP